MRFRGLKCGCYFPCFRYDNVDLSRPARHWVDPSIPSAGRFNFIFSWLGSSVLQIEAVASREMGLYRCRVDYDHHQTLIWWSHLDIVGKGRDQKSGLTKKKGAARVRLVNIKF